MDLNGPSWSIFSHIRGYTLSRSEGKSFRRDATGHAWTLNGGFHGNIYELGISRKPWLIEGMYTGMCQLSPREAQMDWSSQFFCVPKNQTYLALVSFTEATKNPKQAVLNRCSVNILGTSHPQSAIVCWKKARFGVSSLFCDLGMCKHYLLHKWKVKTVMILTNLAWCFHKISTCIVTSYWSVCMCRYAQKTAFHKMIASTARQSFTTCWCHQLVVVFCIMSHNK